MQNQQGLKINEEDKNEQNQMKLAGQVEVNHKFEHNQEQKFGGFDFGLSQGDWGKGIDNNFSVPMESNVSEIEQIKKDEFEYDFSQIDNNDAIDNNNNANSPTQTNDQFQTFQQEATNRLDQSNNKASFFMDQNQQNKQSEQMKEKRLKLQSLYKLSKSRSLLNKKSKQQSQLQQLVKYNQANNNVNIYANANRNTKTLSYSRNTNVNNNNKNNKMQQQQQKDFFSFTQSQQLKQQQQYEEENEFAVFDRPSLFGNKQYHSTYVQQYYSTYVQQQKDEVNSPSNLLHNKGNYNNNDEMSNNFQTQILLSPQSGIIESTLQGQYNRAQIKDNKVFSTKFLPTDLLIKRLIMSIVSITSIALLYGFMNCIFLFIVHDFIFISLIIKQIIRTNSIKNRTNKMNRSKTKDNYFNMLDNTKSVDMNQQLSLNDQLEFPPSSQQFRTNISDKFNQYKSQLQSSLKWHKYLQYTLYISSISMIIFILVQITQLDTFFTANYFSLSNWGHIIIISIIYTLQLWSNCKLNKKINQIMFYQDNYLKSYQSQS